MTKDMAEFVLPWYTCNSGWNLAHYVALNYDSERMDGWIWYGNSFNMVQDLAKNLRDTATHEEVEL